MAAVMGRWGGGGFFRAPHGIEEFVILSILLHLLFILLFGAPAGGSREGRSMWGSMRVVLMEVARPAEPQLKLDQGSASILPGLEPPKRSRPTPTPPPPPKPAPTPPTPAPPVAAAPPAATAPPAAESPAFVPPILDRLAPEAPKAEVPQPSFQVPPPSPPPPVAVPAPEPVAPPITLPSPLPAPAATPVIESPPVIERPPIPTPAVPVPAPAPTPRVPPPTPPVERAPVQAPVVPAAPAERPPVETRALPKEPVPVPAERVPTPAPSPTLERLEPRVQPPASTAPPPAPAPVERVAPHEAPAPAKADPAPGPSPFRASPQLGDFPRGRDAYDPTKPGTDAQSLRDRARALAREGSGNRAALPFPMPPKPLEKSKLEKAIEAARKPDCDKAYAGMGLLAIIPLVANEFGEGNCRWR